MVFPSDHLVGWKSKLKLNIRVWPVIIALNMVWQAVYHCTRMYIFCKYWYLACIMKWYHSILAAISIHTTACNTGQTIQTNTRKYLKSIRANIAICILLVLQVDSHDAGVNTSKHSNMHTVGTTSRFTWCRIICTNTYKRCQYI